MAGSRGQRIAGWILSGVLALFLMGPSAMGKFVEWKGKEEMFAKIGFTTAQMFQIGILEVVIALLFLIPRTSFVGTILLTGYLGGAAVTHLRLNEPFWMPILIGVLLWIALGLRTPHVFALAAGMQKSES